MSSRYWVGGSGIWDGSDTSHWSATSGGASGASVPSNVDDVFVDALSGTSPVITFSGGALQCKDLNFTGAITPTFAGGTGLSIFGSLIRIAAMTWTYTGSLNFSSAAAGKTITSAGGTYLGSVGFTSGGGWTLQDALSTTSNISFTDTGTLNTNGMSVNCTTFSMSGTGIRTLTLGATVFTLSNAWTATTTTNLTFNAGTSTIIMTHANSTFAGGGLTYNNLTFSTSGTMTMTGSNTFNVVTLAAGRILSITSGTTQTITSLVSNGTGASRAVLQSVTAASAATISTASTISVTFLNVQDITRSGAGTMSVINGLNISGNTGITFTSTRYWVGNTGNTNTTASWAYTSGGASGATIPTSVDSVYFDANSFSGAGQVVTVNAAFNCLDMDWTGATNTPTLAGSLAINLYGSLTFIAAMSNTYSGTITCRSTTTGKTITSSGQSFAINFTFDGVGGGWTLQDNLTTTLNITLTNGTLNTNNKNISCSTFSSSNSNVRTVTLGASIITCSSNWTFTTITNLTFTANTATIIMTGATKIFAGGGLTYGTITFTGAPNTITGSNAITTLTISAGKTLNLTSGTTQTVTTLICNGTTASPSTLQAVTAASAATIALPAGRYFIRHTSIKDITVTGATTTTSIAGTNVSGNTGITFVTKFEMGRIKNDGSFNWYSAATGAVTKVSG